MYGYVILMCHPLEGMGIFEGLDMGNFPSFASRHPLVGQVNSTGHAKPVAVKGTPSMSDLMSLCRQENAR